MEDSMRERLYLSLHVFLRTTMGIQVATRGMQSISEGPSFVAKKSLCSFGSQIFYSMIKGVVYMKAGDDYSLFGNRKNVCPFNSHQPH
jgi:hypothetical protein